jgi:DNA-binding response OmpR family regulator
MSRRTALLVEDDPAAARLVCEVLEAMGFEVLAAPRRGDARLLLRRGPCDLVILDRNLPDGDGLDLCVEIRSHPSFQAVPILFLTARGEISERVAGLEGGGDDYLPKPFDVRELRARVEALLKRGGPGRIDFLESGGLRLELAARRALLHGRPLELSPKEFDLLAFLLRFRGRLVSKELLLERVWNYPPAGTQETKTLDVTVSTLRAKLKYFGRRLVTLRGQGYRLDA